MRRKSVKLKSDSENRSILLLVDEDVKSRIEKAVLMLKQEEPEYKWSQNAFILEAICNLLDEVE